MTGQESWKKPGMVDWFKPSLLLHTAVDVVLSTILGKRVDPRRFTSTTDDKDVFFDLTEQAGPPSFDYAADTGEGWENTLALAACLSADFAVASDGQRRERGKFLVLGGDEIYPVASLDRYARQFVWPFNQAARELGVADAEQRPAFLIPGNHDWYDSLVAFTRRFLSGRAFGAFRTQQRRSYFAVKFAPGWQLWGIDIQLGHDIDATQFRYFSDLARRLSAADRVILCSAEPPLVYGAFVDDETRKPLESLIQVIERNHARVPLVLAGDTHNFQHYKAEGRHYIVSGGGGAFLHPTHGFDAERECLFRHPSEADSQRLEWRNALFALKHLPMSLFLGALYVALTWSILPSELGDPRSLLRLPFDHPVSALLALATLAGFRGFADGRSTRKKNALGLAHGLLHLASAAATAALATLVTRWAGAEDTLADYAAKAIQLVVGGGVGGSLFGGYLWASLRFLRVHRNEAFSALECPDYKHFLRCKIDADNRLRVCVLPVTPLPQEGIKARAAGPDAEVHVGAALYEICIA